MIRPGGIGDCLLCFPAMQDLAAHDATETEVWVPGPVVPLVEFAHTVRSIVSTGIDTVGVACRPPGARLVDTLRSFDSIVSWYGSNREEFAAALRSIGVDAEFRTALPPSDCPLHAVDFFLRVSSPTGRYPLLSPPPVQTGTSPFIAVHPFSGSTHKNWPLAKFRELESRLPLPVVYCTSPDQPQQQRLSGATVVQYADLYRLAGFLRGAALYIGNDSGITHLAAASGVPTVAVFGYSDPKIWGPLGTNVRIVEAASSLDGLAVDSVLDAVHALLRGR